MTLQKYVAYEELLQEHNFQHTQKGDPKQYQNWVRDTDSPLEVQRVFLQNDGTFKAYRLDGNQVCHGDAAWQLKGCF